MKKYKVAYGLNGGFGGAQECDSIYEFKNEEEALDFAREKAIEVYESYEGCHGLRSVTDIIEEEGYEEESEHAEEQYQEERDGWLDYEVFEII